MSPEKQTAIGVVLLLLAVLAAVLQITQHQDTYSIVAVFLGAVGGQQAGQARARSKR